MSIVMREDSLELVSLSESVTLASLLKPSMGMLPLSASITFSFATLRESATIGWLKLKVILRLAMQEVTVDMYTFCAFFLLLNREVTLYWEGISSLLLKQLLYESLDSELLLSCLFLLCFNKLSLICFTWFVYVADITESWLCCLSCVMFKVLA